MKVKKAKVIAVLLSAVIFLSSLGVSAYASNNERSAYADRESRKEEIMAQYFDAIRNHEAASDSNERTIEAHTSFSEIKANTVEQLNALGYEAYDVNPENYQEIEQILNTDFESAGLSADGSYLILIEGEDGDCVPFTDKYSAEFKHTYNGKTYRMRWMTAYPVKGNQMHEWTENLVFYTKLNAGNVIQTIGEALTLVGKCIPSEYGTTVKKMGSVASVFGEVIAKYIENRPDYASLTGRADSMWTRRFTQVYDTSYNSWINRVYVESVDCSMSVTTSYFDPNENGMRYLHGDTANKVYSPKYNDMAWRKNGAAIAADADITYKYGVPSVDYKFNGKVIETHANRLPK